MTNPVSSFTTTTTGGHNQPPVAHLAHTKIDTLIGSVIQLDGRKSYDPEKQPLTYKWSFTQVPKGSEVETAGFKFIRPNGAAVSFIPDKTGLYVVQLVVNDGELDSSPISCVVNIQLSRVPHGENVVPDAQFLWAHFSDFWRLIEDRDKITTVWSSVIQSIGSDLITLWGNDYNKSLDTIQSTFQRRWHQISMYTDVSELYDQRIITGKTDSGINGASGTLGETPGVGTTSVFYLPRGNVGDGDKANFRVLEGNYGPRGRVIVINGETYTISRVSNQNLEVVRGDDLDASSSANTVSTTSTDFSASQAGDLIFINDGSEWTVYRVKSVDGPNDLTLVYPNDPPGGPVPEFSLGTDLGFAVEREFTSVIVADSEIPDGIIGASWRVPHLLHVPGADFEKNGVSAGDVLVFEAGRKDVGLTTEVYAQVVGCDGDRIGFEFSTSELEPSTNSGSGASLVESAGVVTVSGLENMRPASVNGYLEILNGDNPGKYRIVEYIADDTVVIGNTLAAGADSGNPDIQWVERGRVALNLERDLFRKIVRDLRVGVQPTSGDTDVAIAAETLIRHFPIGVNLSTRPFAPFGITIRAKRVIHNSKIKVPDELVSAPVLQEQPVDPPVVLRENLDYIVEGGYIEFEKGLFSLLEHSPDNFWAECALFDNSSTIENNFGRLVQLAAEDISSRRTSAPYLSAVKGLFFAYTNGPTVANIRLGLQILLGLPFAEEDGVILEVQENFSEDVNGTPLGRVLIEDVDLTTLKKTGFRRVYLYPTEVGLEINPSTGVEYATGDTIRRFAPISKGVEVVDYIKDPLWWKYGLNGMEILKYFTFKVAVDSSVFSSDEVDFGLEFVRKIKPAYTNVITAALLNLSDDISVEEQLALAIVLKFYDNTWGLEATNRADDFNQQGVVLNRTGSSPFSTRTPRLLHDVETSLVGPDIHATSTTGWDTDVVRGRDDSTDPVQEGDHLHIHPGQSGSGLSVPGVYEIAEVIDANNLRLLTTAYGSNPSTFEYDPLGPNIFVYGSGLTCSIMRRGSNPIIKGDDLTAVGGNLVSSSSAKFLTNGVMPGDHLVIEVGGNVGEYYITGHLSNPPYISEDTVALLNLDGTVPTISLVPSPQSFRVVRPVVASRRIEGAKSVWNGTDAQMEIEIPDPNDGSSYPFDVFTPAMVGGVINVSGSEAGAVNDGDFQITKYLGPSRIATNSASSSSDASADSVLFINP